MRTLLFMIFAFFWFTSHSYAQTNQPYQLETIASDLDYPWSITFLSDDDYLVSMRSGELRRISSDGTVNQLLANTPKTYVASQGGYFDVVLDPDFATNKTLYLAFAHGTPSANGTRVVKARLLDKSVDNVQTIFTVEPLKDTPVHYGGRLQFINDGTLLVTTGDGFDYREAAQDKFSQLGKIIRINRDGSVPKDNPFADGNAGNPKVYSVGHRNPQGLAYDSVNNIIYLHEHGPKGGDEVNIIKAGNNYGWPATSYGVNYSGALVSPLTQAPGITDPIKQWTPSIAPSGLALYSNDLFPQWQGSLFIGALVDKDVSRLTLKNGQVVSEEKLFSELDARIRDIRSGPNGHLYILTDSPQGKLIRVSPQ